MSRHHASSIVCEFLRCTNIKKKIIIYSFFTEFVLFSFLISPINVARYPKCCLIPNWRRRNRHSVSVCVCIPKRMAINKPLNGPFKYEFGQAVNIINKVRHTNFIVWRALMLQKKYTIYTQGWAYKIIRCA